MKHAYMILAFASALIPLIHASNYEQADREFAHISEILEKADTAFEKEDWEEARKQYTTARRAYEQFSESFPTFAPDLIQFRITYCSNQASLSRQNLQEQEYATEEQPAPPTAEEAPAEHIAITPSLLQALQDGELDTVREAYEEKSAREDPAAYLVRAALFVMEDELDQAHETLEQFLQRSPANPAAHYNMAQLIMRMDQPDFEKAREHYRQAREGGAPRDEDLEIVIDFE